MVTDISYLPQFATAALIDDHHSNRNQLKGEYYLGFLSSGGVPRCLCCVGMPGFLGWFNINEVYRDEQGNLHLSTRSLLTIKWEELKRLQTEGSMSFDQPFEGMVRVHMLRKGSNLPSQLCPMPKKRFMKSDTSIEDDLREILVALRDIDGVDISITRSDGSKDTCIEEYCAGDITGGANKLSKFWGWACKTNV